MPVLDSGVVSSFKFHSYKVDDFRFSMEKQIGILEFQGSYDKDAWDLVMSIRQPIYFERRNYYVSGLGCRMELKPEKEPKAPVLAVVEAGISGVFSTEQRFTEEQEESIVKAQLPAILFPYLRGAITSFLANAGFGSFVFPLINMQEVARQTLKDVKPAVISGS